MCLLGEVDFSICKGSISDKTPSAFCVYLLIECNHFPGLPAEGSEIRSGYLTIFPVTTLFRLVEIQFCCFFFSTEERCNLLKPKIVTLPVMS